MKTHGQQLLKMTIVFLMVFSTPIFASEVDSKIESSFQESYVARNYLAGDTVKAESKDGVVTLSGTVRDESHRSLAQETAENLPGVISVDNRLKVNEGAPAAEKAPSGPSASASDLWLAAKVNAALLFHRNVSMAQTRVDAKNGVVTLQGEAESEAQKELTGKYANVEGVREVRNEMTVSKAPAPKEMTVSKPANEKRTLGEKIDDASITAQVKMVLLTHRSTSALRTKVETKQGVVILSGKAANAAEKDLVTELVKDIHGVKSAVNNMTIE